MSTLRPRRKFTPEFKAEAVAMVEAAGGNIAQVAKELGIAELERRMRHCGYAVVAAMLVVAVTASACGRRNEGSATRRNRLRQRHRRARLHGRCCPRHP